MDSHVHFVCRTRLQALTQLTLVYLFKIASDRLGHQSHPAVLFMRQAVKHWLQSRHWCCPWEHTAEADKYTTYAVSEAAAGRNT
jgi:hypothetical protein